jgi:hypothetical protein
VRLGVRSSVWPQHRGGDYKKCALSIDRQNYVKVHEECDESEYGFVDVESSVVA